MHLGIHIAGGENVVEMDVPTPLGLKVRWCGS